MSIKRRKISVKNKKKSAVLIILQNIKKIVIENCVALIFHFFFTNFYLIDIASSPFSLKAIFYSIKIVIRTSVEVWFEAGLKYVFVIMNFCKV